MLRKIVILWSPWEHFSQHFHPSSLSMAIFMSATLLNFISNAHNPKPQVCVIWSNVKQNKTLALMVYFHCFQLVDCSLPAGYELFSGSQLNKRSCCSATQWSYLVGSVKVSSLLKEKTPPYSVYKSKIKLNNTSIAKMVRWAIGYFIKHLNLLCILREYGRF